MISINSIDIKNPEDEEKVISGLIETGKIR